MVIRLSLYFNYLFLFQARAIMFLASNSSNMVNPRTEGPVLTPIKAAKVEGLTTNQTKNQSHPAPPCSGLAATMSVTSHIGSHTLGASSVADDRVGVKAVGTLAPVSQNESPKTVTQPIVPTPSAPMMPRGIIF